jgi:hypothetical protein
VYDRYAERLYENRGESAGASLQAGSAEPVRAFPAGVKVLLMLAGVK